MLRNRRAVFFKSMGSAVTVEDETVFGYLAGYGNVDEARDRLHKGCCAKSIAERGPGTSTPRKIAMLYHHFMHMPVGQFTKLEEQSKGLYYEGKLDMIPFVKETLKPQLKSGTINNHSIGYNYVFDNGKMVYDEKANIYDIYELDLFEGSFLPLGMNENTPFGGFKKFLLKSDHYGELALEAEKALKGMRKMPKKEYELRTIIQKYQSLLDSAADEMKTFTAKEHKPTNFDYEYLLKTFKETK